jgi:hypothetical protein
MFADGISDLLTTEPYTSARSDTLDFGSVIYLFTASEEEEAPHQLHTLAHVEMRSEQTILSLSL